MEDLTNLNSPVKIGLLDGSLKVIRHNEKVQNLPMKEVYFVPNFKHSVIYVSRILLDENYLSIFYNKGCVMQDISSSQVVASEFVENRVHKLRKEKRRA